MSLICYSTPGPGRADFNMAFDEWLLARAIKSPGEIYLRLYQWEVGSITFGVNQREELALDHSRLGETPLLRRVTGGRALYHDPSDLTYCIAFNTDRPPCEKLAGSISETSVVIAEAIRGFLIRIGVRTDWVRASSKENGQPEFFHKAPCFASSAKYELRRGSQKVVASAQRRFGSALMQHGSIKIGGIVAHPALGTLPQTETSPQLIDKEEFAKYVALFGEKFALPLGVDLSQGELSEAELAKLDEYAVWVNKNRVAKRLVSDEGIRLLGLAPQSV